LELLLLSFAHVQIKNIIQYKTEAAYNSDTQKEWRIITVSI
jgi:hypothetical protein